MSSPQLKAALAKTLEIEPDQIMDYAPLGGGKYNVILFNFMKFVDVVPTIEEEPPEEQKPPARKRRTTTKKSSSGSRTTT